MGQNTVVNQTWICAKNTNCERSVCDYLILLLLTGSRLVCSTTCWCTYIVLVTWHDSECTYVKLSMIHKYKHCFFCSHLAHFWQEFE